MEWQLSFRYRRTGAILPPSTACLSGTASLDSCPLLNDRECLQAALPGLTNELATTSHDDDSDNPRSRFLHQSPLLPSARAILDADQTRQYTNEMDADRMEAAQPLTGTGSAGDLSWRLSSHPITLLTFLAFRICEPPARRQLLSKY